MKKIILILIFSVFFSANLYAQDDIPSGTFETTYKYTLDDGKFLEQQIITEWVIYIKPFMRVELTEKHGESTEEYRYKLRDIERFKELADKNVYNLIPETSEHKIRHTFYKGYPSDIKFTIVLNEKEDGLFTEAIVYTTFKVDFFMELFD